MTKLIESIIVLALLLFSFFIGVKYSDQVKNRAGWLFESKEEEIELPTINGDGGTEVEIPADEANQYMNQEVIIDEGNGTAPEKSPAPEAAPAAAPVTAPVVTHNKK